MEPQETSPKTKEIVPLLADAAAFLKFAKTVDAVVSANRPTKSPAAAESLMRAIMTGNFPIVNFAVTEARRAGLTFKDMELYCRKNNAKCWFVATELPKAESNLKAFSFGENDEPIEFQIMISTHNAYAVFSSFFAEDPKKYTENFNRLNRCGFLQLQGADTTPPDTNYKVMKFAN